MKKVQVIRNDKKSYTIKTSTKLSKPLKIGNKLLDLTLIGNCVFIIEDLIKNDKLINEVIMPLYESYSSKLNDEIEQLIDFLFNKHIKITFIKNPQKQLQGFSDEFYDGFTCLFSGGLDSFSGILNSSQNYDHVTGASTIHADQRQLKDLIDKLQNLALGKYGITVKTIDAPKNKNYTRITRGFLYLLNGMLLKNKNIIIAEVGPTMYQPRFTLLDDISFTTHPKVIQSAQRIMQEVLDTHIKIIKPNENLTKAEVAAISPEKNFLKLTCSCRTIRFCNSNRPNRGTCYGCVVRRIAMLVAGIGDSLYKNDILLSRESKNEQYDNVLHLLQFSLDFLNDYEDMPNYSVEIIKRYSKEALFERFSLDTFAALLSLKKEGKLLDKIFLKFLESSLRIVSSEKLEDRISAVRNKEFKPDFNNII